MPHANDRVNVLLTGAGGDQSVFIWKALNQSTIDTRIVAADSNHLSVGLYRTDRGYVVPKASQPEFLPRIKALIAEEQIDIVMIGGMAEMMVLAEHAREILDETGAYVAVPPLEVLQVASDKWNLVQFLKTNGFSYPESWIPEEPDSYERFLEATPFPYIVKGRFGAGSQQLAVAHDRAELEQALRTIENPVIQEYLWPDDEEFTVGCFCDRNARAVGTIVMKRSLGHGMTHKASVVHHEAISRYCEAVAESLGYVGPLNLQLRLTSRGPVLFEINPRFSSTESARAYFNFNMPEMCIRHFVFEEEIPRPQVRPGYFFRVLDEVFVDGESVAKVRETGVSREISGTIVQNF